jgi:hypothetical protein
MSRRPAPIKTPETLAALNVLTTVRFAKRPMLEKLMAKKLGRVVTDDQFETAMSALGHRIIRTRGQGACIRLVF